MFGYVTVNKPEMKVKDYERQEQKQRKDHTVQDKGRA